MAGLPRPCLLFAEGPGSRRLGPSSHEGMPSGQQSNLLESRAEVMQA